MQRLNDAYAVLSNPERRATYDRQWRERTQVEPGAETRSRSGGHARNGAQAAEARPEGQQRAGRGHQSTQQRHYRERQTASPPRPTARSRIGRVLSEWFGVVFFVALIAVSGSERLQRTLDDAWSWIADLASVGTVSRGSDSNGATQSLPRTPAGGITSGERAPSGRPSFGRSTRQSLGTPRIDAPQAEQSASVSRSSPIEPGPRSTTEQSGSAVTAPASPTRRVPANERSRVNRTPISEPERGGSGAGFRASANPKA